jgi:hypothetical protein
MADVMTPVQPLGGEVKAAACTLGRMLEQLYCVRSLVSKTRGLSFSGDCLELCPVLNIVLHP